MQTIKGWSFVLVSAGLIYIFLLREIKSLRESEERFSKIFHASPFAMNLFSLSDNTSTLANDTFLNLIGYSRDELVGHTAAELNLFVDPSIRFAWMKELREAGSTKPQNIQMRKKSGEIRDVSASIEGIDVGGRKMGLVMAMDITERKRAEEALRENEERLKLVLVGSQLGYWDWNIETGEVYRNARWAEMLGYTLSEIEFTVKQWSDLHHPDDRERATQAIQDHLDGKSSGYRIEYRMRMKDGSYKWILDQARVVKRDAQGKPLRMSGTHADISERKEAEARLSKSQNLLQGIIDHSPSLIYELDTDGHFILANQKLESLFGLADLQIIGKTRADFLPPEIAQEHLKNDVQVINSRQASLFEEENQEADGKHFYLTLKFPLINADDQVYAVCGISTDITERKKAEAALRLSEERFSNAFHVSPAAITITRIADGKFIDVNEAFLHMFEFNRDEVVGHTSTEINMLDLEERAVLIQAQLESGGLKNAELKARSKSGRAVHLLFSSKPMELDGEACHVTILIDVTERKQAEDRLRESEERYRQLLDVSPVGVAVHSGGRVVFTNPAGAKLVGAKNLEDIVGKPITEIIHPDNLRTSAQRIQRMMAGETGLYPVEDRYLRLDGSEVPVEVMAVPLTYEGKTAVQVIVQDITERKQAEEKLHLQTAILEVSANAIIITDREGIIQWANPAFTALTGFNAMEDALGKNPRDLIRSGLQDENFYRNLWDTILAGKVWRGELVNRHKDGTFYDEEMTITPFANANGVITNFIAVKQDITERKRAEKQVQLQLRRMSALNEIDRAISSSLDMHLSLDVVLSQVLSQLGVDAASVLLLNPFSQTLEYVSGKGFRTLGIRQSRVQLGEGLAGKVGLERKSLHVPYLVEADGQQIERFQLIKDEEFVEYYGIPLIAKGLLKGVLEVFHRTPLDPDLDWLNYLETLGGQAAIAIDNVQMFEGVQQSNLELVTAYDATIAGWSRAMDLRDKETEGHTLRVTELTVQLAKKMGISQQEIVQMRRGALLHDIGKLGVPDNILLKPDALTKIEWAVMRQHPSYAFNMLMSINYLRPALDIPYCHHEKWDGSGYPRALSGEQIPLAARIFAIIDVWDALRSDRPYRAAWTIEKTREHIVEQSGTHFDPQVVEAFISLLDESPDMR